MKLEAIITMETQNTMGDINSAAMETKENNIRLAETEHTSIDQLQV